MASPVFEKALQERLKMHSGSTEQLSHGHTFKRIQTTLKSDPRPLKIGSFCKNVLHKPEMFKNITFPW